MREGDVEVERWPDVAQTVGTDDAQAVRLGDADDLLLQPPALGADLLEARRHDNGPRHAGLAALTDHVRHALGRHGDDSQVDLAWHLADGRIGLDALDRRSGGIDGIHDTVVFGADEVAQQDVADRPLFVGGADDGDALGVEQFVQVCCAHAPTPAFAERNRRNTTTSRSCRTDCSE